jgi:hypothetical protein
MNKPQKTRSSLSTKGICYVLHKIFLATAIVFSSVMTDVAEAGTPSSVHDVVIEVSGEVPGFTHEQLVTYLTGKMHEEITAPWHFAAGKPGEESASNRVVWSFKTLREVWKGGTHNGFPSPSNSQTYLRAEVKLYIKGAYQMTLDMHPTVSGGADDKILSVMVHHAVQTLFVENKPDMQ